MGLAECSVADCTTKHYSRGFCRAHYYRLDRYGDPLGMPPPRVRPVETHRVCKTCGETKTIDEYSPGGRGRPRCRECKPCRAARMRSNYSPEKNRAQKLRSKYGITQAEYEAMLKAQGNVCAICCTRPNETLRVDHNHETDAIRGLLCDWCNTGLGKFRDDPALLGKAATYLLQDSS